MFINKQFKQTSDSNGNTDSELINSNAIKLKISSSSKKYPSVSYTLLPKLNESEKRLSKRNNNDYLDLEENTNTDYKEELYVISTLWDELGVTEDYRYQFNQILESNICNPKIMFCQEKENLKKFKTSLIKLKKEIYNRENNIENLIKIIKTLETQKEANQNLLKEAINIIKNLRLNAVNIVIYINRVRELGFYYYFQGKWDLTKIKNEYMYNNNYLLQMSEDLNFLKNSCLSKYIEMGNEKIDAFITNCSQLNKEYMFNNNKIIIPISDDLIQLIEQSIFFVIQDQIMDNIYQKKSLAINKNNSNNINGMNMNRSNSTKIKIKKVQSRPMTSKGVFNGNKNREIGKIKNIFNDLDTNKLINTLKNGNNSEYNSLFQLSKKLSDPKNNLIPESTRIKNRVRNQDDYNSSAQKKIKIEHEIISSMNLSNGKNKTYINRNDSNEQILLENEKLKKDNQIIKHELQKLNERIEENEKFKKSLEDKLILQKKEMDYNSISVEEIKMQLLKDKKDLEQKLKEEINKNIKIKSENEKIIKKEIQLQYDKSKSGNSYKYLNIYKKHNLPKNKTKHKIEYYKGDIDILINNIKSSKIIDNIDPQLKQIFNLENKIHDKNAYLIGQYPKIIILKSNEDINTINGICSLYYNNTINETGILNINFICAIREKENSFENIYDIIKFIKDNENFAKIIIKLEVLNNT